MVRRMGAFLAALVASLGWCIGAVTLVGGDPMLAIEIAGVVVASIWAIVVVRDLRRAGRLARRLSFDAVATSLFGVRFLVTRFLGPDALVIGAVRPRIFVGADLMDGLSDDELRAVVYHEDHHRRTWAPTRAAALEAWIRLFGRSKRVRAIVLDRLADLETLADADAIRRGSSARSLARALLKGDASLQPSSFGYAAERRVGQLLDHAAGNPLRPARRPPFEWLPVILLGVAALGCHVGL